MEKYLTTKQIADALHLTPETIAVYASRGLFTGAFKARSWLIPESGFEQFKRDRAGIKNPDSSPNAIAPRSRRARSIHQRKAS